MISITFFDSGIDKSTVAKFKTNPDEFEGDQYVCCHCQSSFPKKTRTKTSVLAALMLVLFPHSPAQPESNESNGLILETLGVIPSMKKAEVCLVA